MPTSIFSSSNSVMVSIGALKVIRHSCHFWGEEGEGRGGGKRVKEPRELVWYCGTHGKTRKMKYMDN